MPLDIDNPEGELVIDPYRAKECYQDWDGTIPGISKKNQNSIRTYLADMRLGTNLGPNAKRGKRGYRRLLTQRNRLKRISELLAENQNIQFIAPIGKEDTAKLEQALGMLFLDMEDGGVRKRNGERFRSTTDHIKSFKAFWHWHMTRTHRATGQSLADITTYLSAKNTAKPKFVFFGKTCGDDVEEGFRQLFERANHRYRPVLAFMFDSGVRSPTELMNIKGKDITPVSGTPYFQLTIREETTKTFGRRIQLMFCHDILRRYLAESNPRPEDFLFPIKPRVFNQYLKRLGARVLGAPNLTMYDFRHNSVCYYLPRYTNRSGLIYRFGWSSEKMIKYYTEFLGMRDTITEDDMIATPGRTQLERDLDNERRNRSRLDEEITLLRGQLNDINQFMNKMTEDPKVLDILSQKAQVLKDQNEAPIPG